MTVLQKIGQNPAVQRLVKDGTLPEVPTVVEFDMESTIKTAVVIVVMAAAIIFIWKLSNKH